MKLELPSSISSPQDVTGLIQEVQDYANWFSQAVVKKRADSNIPKPPILSPAAKTVVDTWDGDQPLSRQRLDGLLQALEDYKASAPHMDITLAAPSTEAIKAELVTWCRQNLAANTLVSFSFNRSLLGGMVVRFGSHIYDWSFRKQIIANQDKFVEVLKNV